MEVIEHTGDPAPVAGVLRELRPHFGTDDALASGLRELTRTQGLRIFGAHVAGDRTAAAAVTVRMLDSLAHGRILYVDDLVTAAGMRGRGLAGALMDRIDALARDAGIPGRVHLDSGVHEARADAHAFYFARGMRIASYRFVARDQR